MLFSKYITGKQMTEIFFRYLHFIGIMSLSATLVAQHLIISSQVTREQFKKIAFLDLIYIISIILTLIGGLSLWLFVGKDASFYSTNWVFHLKLAMFVLVILLSIYPTKFFLKNKKTSDETIKIPKVIVMLFRMQLALIFIMPLLGVLIARG
jgi:putative membrane protein